MKQATRGVLAVLLAAVMLLVGCTKPGNQGTESGTKQETDPNVTEDDLYADLPQHKFDNQSFVILNNISDYAITTMVPDDLSSAINSAIYSRNEYVKQELEIDLKVKELPYAENKELMDRLVTSDLGGENEYDICYNAAFTSRSIPTPLTSISTSPGGTARQWRSCRCSTTSSMWLVTCS